MAITASNSLAGTDGVQPTLTTLGQTGDAPDALDNTLLEYDNAYTVHSYNTLRLTSNYARHDTGRLTFDLPAFGPWSVRFWVRPEPLSDPYDMLEYRHLFTIGSSTLVMRESSGRNVVTRLQPEDLAAANAQGTETGSPVTFDQLLRYEILFDGVDTLECSVFAGDATTGARVNTWTHTPDDVQMVLSGYRWRKYDTLENGDNDASLPGTPVEDYQNKLLVWDPNSLPEFGADGDFGAETVGATEDFQTERGLVVDGVAGPETQSALDLVVALDSDPNDYPIPFWVGGLTITDTGAAIGPLDEIDSTADATVSVDGDVVVEDTTTVAHGDVSVSGDVSVTTAVAVPVDGPLSVDGDVTVFKATSSDPAEAEVGVSGNVVYTAQSLIPPPPPVPPQARLVVYSPDGSYQGILPNVFSWEASMPLNDVGSLTLTYSAAAPGTDVLLPTSALYSQNPFEIALEFKTAESSQWVEPPHCRFISLRRKRDLVDRTQMVQWTLANYGWMLRKAKIIEGLIDGERSFASVSAGGPLSIAYDEAIARGSLNGMVALFTGGVDSSSNSWAHSDFDIVYPAGVDMLTMVEAFTEQGLVDWRFDERVFQLYNAGTTMQRDRTEYILRLYGVATEAPEEWAYDDYSRRVTALYGTSNTVTVSNTGGPDYWGRWDDFINMTGEDSVLADATDAADVRMDETQNPRRQESRRYVVDGIQPIPLIHYLPGDLVGVEIDGDPGIATVSRRVHQITYSYDADRILKSTITVGDRFIVPEVQMRRRIDWTTNRASRVVGAGSGKNLQ